MRPHLLTLALVLAATASTRAQEPAAIKTMEDSAEMHSAAERFWRGYEGGLSTHCTSASFDWVHGTHRVYGKPTVAPDGKLINAIWVETVPGSGCGEAKRYRALISVQNGARSLVPLYPGESIASPNVEDEVVEHLPTASRAYVPAGQKCKLDVLDTRVVGGAPINGRQPWNEAWTIALCGKRLSVPIRFVPDATGPGTSIQLSAKAITPVK